MENGKNIYLVIVLFALLVLAGFYFMFDKIGSLETEIKNLELQIELSKNKPETTTQTPPPASQESQNAQEQTPPDTTSANSNTIATAILFNASSSPALQPQTQITVSVESVSKSSDGTITVAIKAFTNNATAYSAFEPRDYFEMISLTAENQKPIQAIGQFNSIPPKSSISGSVTFKIDPSVSTIILQTGSGDNLKFYEFNFSKKTYKETVIG